MVAGGCLCAWWQVSVIGGSPGEVAGSCADWGLLDMSEQRCLFLMEKNFSGREK